MRRKIVITGVITASVGAFVYILMVLISHFDLKLEEPTCFIFSTILFIGFMLFFEGIIIALFGALMEEKKPIPDNK